MLACGSSNGGGVPGFIPKGNFSNASLNGQYVYQIEGFDFTTNLSGVPYREAGVFTADGNGDITSATDDFSEGNTCPHHHQHRHLHHQQRRHRQFEF